MTETGKIEGIRQQFEAQLMNIRGVVSVGLGLGPGGRPCLLIGTSVPPQQVREELPPELQEQVDIKIEFTGAIEAGK